MKKDYQTPALERFGTVSELSAGGSAPGAENVAGDPAATTRRD